MTDATNSGELAFAEALASRLCHDVAGLIGTLAGTLEMALEGAADSEAAELATEVAAELSARIRLYRAAWGGGDLEYGTLATLIQGLPNRTKYHLGLSALNDGDDLPQGGPRLLLCLLLAACAGMPAGGTIDAAPVAGIGFTVGIAGRGAAWPKAVTDPEAADCANARLLAAPLAAMVARAGGWRLTVEGQVLSALH